MITRITESVVLREEHKIQAVHVFAFLLPAVSGVNPRRINATVSKNGGKRDNIVTRLVVGSGEQVPEIMRKDFIRRDFRGLPDALHHSPDVAPV